LILVDTGPLVALFDPSDDSHARCVRVLQSVDEPLATTIPVLTEAFHLLTPGSTGAQRLMDFISESGLTVWSFDDGLLSRCFELMIQYADRPMDLADASLVALAEAERLNRIFTIDRNDFATYRSKRGHRHYQFEVVG
jgi:predicted nucleic acid-binding protein